MRQLLVPACLCLMTWSSATGSDLPTEKLSGSSTFDKRALMRAIAEDAHAEQPLLQTASAIADIPAEAASADAVVADIPDDDSIAPAEADAQPVPLPPVRQAVVRRSREEICDTIARAAQKNDLPVPFFIRLLFQESRFEPDAVSSTGAQGIAQFMPETAADEGLVNPFDPLQAIPASARLLRKFFQQFGNLGLAAAAYNAGPRRIHDWLAKKDKLPHETQGYVRIVTGRAAENWRAAKARGPELTLPHHAPCKDEVPAPARTEMAAAKKIERRSRLTAKSDKPPEHEHKLAARKTAAHKPKVRTEKNKQLAQR